MAHLPLREEDTVVFLGDYVDRGEDSAATVAAAREFAREHRACVFLRGNHEDDWLEQWDGGRFRRPATIVGAMQTWLDFDEDIPPDVGDWMRSTLIDYRELVITALFLTAGARAAVGAGSLSADGQCESGGNVPGVPRRARLVELLDGRLWSELRAAAIADEDVLEAWRRRARRYGHASRERRSRETVGVVVASVLQHGRWW